MPCSTAITPWCRASCWSRRRFISCSICSPTSPISWSIRDCADERAGRCRSQRALLKADERSNACRRALRRLFPPQGRDFGWSSLSCSSRRGACAAAWRPMTPSRRLDRGAQGTEPRRIGSAPTSSAATLSRVIFGARASLLAGVISVRHRAVDRRAARAAGRLSPAALSTR